MLRRNTLGQLAAVSLVLSAPAVFGADAKPVAHVGSETVSAEALSRRIAKIPYFQRAALADSPSALKRQVLTALLIPEFLYAQEAERLKLGERPSVQSRQRELLRVAMEHALREEVDAKRPVTAEDIRGYFEHNRARFETPRRLHIWRILSDDSALAEKIIADSKGADGVQRWSQYARDSSLDKATQLRNGDLGFVHPDGNTDIPTLRVDPELFSAADLLSDGELAAKPIKEGLHWAVIWRRGSLKAVTRSLDQEQGSIRQVLERQRLEQARDELLTSLRAKYLSGLNEAALDNVRFDSAGLPAREASARPAHAAAAGSSIPQPGDRGTR